MIKKIANRAEEKAVEMFPGFYRTTLAFNDDLMLCHFLLNKGAEIPLHSHLAVQNGYVIKGRIQLKSNDGNSFIIGAGASYVFDSNEPHGAVALEDSEYVETFFPVREEYFPKETIDR